MAMNSEVASIVHSVVLNAHQRDCRRDLSAQFFRVFREKGWEPSSTLYFRDSRKNTPHFTKNGVLAMFSWRHYEKIGSEILKFQKEYALGSIKAGVYICMTKSLAEYIKSQQPKTEKPRSFNDSINLERAQAYLEEVSSIITIPLAVMGLVPPTDEQEM